jgi:hypothetical protein
VAAERTRASSGIGRKPAVGPLRARFTLSRDPAYLVEFVDDQGVTKAEAAFTPDQLSATPPPP